MKHTLKVFTIFMGCLLFRLLPLRAPNLEPIMASIMPVGKRYGATMAFLFGAVSMVLYDIITGHVGAWTWITALAYGSLGAAASFYFRRFKEKAGNFAIFAFVATILFDVVTGILPAPYFGVSMTSAAIGQIPFTALHLAGNIGFALTLSPLLNKWLLSEKFFTLKEKAVPVPEGSRA